MAFQMHGHHRVPLFLAHVKDHAVTQNTRAVDQNIELAKAIGRILDQILAAFDRRNVLGIRDCLTTRFLNLIDHLLGMAGILAFTINTAAQVVDHNLSALFCHQQSDTTPDTTPRTGNCRNFSLKFTHWYSSLLFYPFGNPNTRSPKIPR